jgi:anion-transporting  ArsA/GET3 family ATPase
MSASTFDVLDVARSSRIVLCCGSGGVGKTTTSAAIAYLAATHGRRVLVMTIDPARRLAQALGLESLGDAPARVPGFASPRGGELSAMVLDSKRTFDALIEKYASSPAVRETIFANAYYQHLSASLSGSREFMALEKVYEVVTAGGFDLVVVDTPPSQHALEFLDAPKRLFDLFEGTFVKLLLQPYRVAGRIGFEIFRRSSEAFLGVLEKLSGYQVLADLSDFFLAFSGMFDGFKERSRTVMRMLAEPTTSFVLVAAPDPVSLGAADVFFARLERERLPVGGLIVNRVHEIRTDATEDRLTDADLNALGRIPADARFREPFADRLLVAYRDHRSLAVLDASVIEATALSRAAMRVRRVPHFDRDLHSLDDVAAFAARLSDQAS